MNRRALLTPLLLCLLLPPRPALATVAFTYRWETPRVRVTWKEGNEWPELAGARRQVGHWKRLAQTLWAMDPAAPPLAMTVSLYGEQLGSDGPKVTLKSGSRGETVTAPLTEEAVYAALLRARGPAVPAPSAPPADDADARISPDGEWVSCVSWRGGGPEVRVARRTAGTVTRIPFPGTGPVTDRLVQALPRWSADGRLLAWIQGGRLVLFDAGSRSARLATDGNQRAVDFQWPVNPTAPLLVRFDDERFHLLDLLAGAAVPVSELLEDAVPMGEFFWSPSGRRLLFRTQTRIVTAGLTVPGRVAGAWKRFLDRMVGPGEPPAPEYGPHEERLAVLDLGARRLDTFPIQGTPLYTAELRGVNWSPREDLLFATAEQPGTPGGILVRYPLRRDEPPATVFRSDRPILPLGARTDPGASPAEQIAPRQTGYAFLHGDRVLIVRDGSPPELSHPYSPTETLSLAARPGPQGGYLGVEDEALTEDEPGTHVVLESLTHTSGAAIRRPFPGGLLVTTVLEGGIVRPLRVMVEDGTAADLDIHPQPENAMAVIVAWTDGGVGRLLTSIASADNPLQAAQDNLSLRMSETPAGSIAPVDNPYRLTDVETGAAALAGRYQRFNRGRLVLAGLSVLALLAILLLFRRRLRMRD